MHQSPWKQLGGFRRVKNAALEAFEGDAEADRRLLRGNPPKARRFAYREREDDLRAERSRERPRG